MSDTASEPEIEAAEGVEIPDTAVASEPEAESAAEAEPETEPVADAAPEPEPQPELPFTLDELVADLASSGPGDEANADAARAAEDESPSMTAAEESVEAAEQEVEPAAPKPLLRRVWTRAPFWAVDAAWAILTLAAVIALWRAPAATFADGIAYGVLVLGGAALAFIGLMTSLIVWLVARSRAGQDERVGLGLAIWTRALIWTAGGVALWWVGLLVLDLHHSGVIG
ncbi:MAG TPA: hypothetical protein VIK38_13590 [Coriobacteriia bacterium]